jgi:oligosaccharide repeat unit polymerase
LTSALAYGPTSQSPRLLRLGICGVVLAILLAMVTTGAETSIGPMSWSIACIVVALAISVARVGHERFDVFDPIVVIMAYLAFLFGARGMFVLEFDPYYFLPYATPALLSKALAYANIGMISIYVGYCLAAGVRLAEIAPIPRLLVVGEDWFPSIVIVLAAVIGFGGLAVFSILRGASFAPDVTVAAGTFWLTPIMNLLPCSLLLALTNGEHHPKTMPRIASLVVLTGCVLTAFFVFNSKLFVVETFLMALVVRHYRVRRLRVGVVVMLMLASFIVMQCVKLSMGQYSGHFSMLLATMFQSWDELWMDLFSRFYGLDSMVAIIIHTHRGNYEWGRSFAELLYWWIPRGLWPGKPYSWAYDFSFLLANYNNPSDAGFFSAPTFLGELYLNFGVPGVVIGGVVFGIVARATYVYFVRRTPTKAGLLIYGIALVHLGQLCESTLAVAIVLMLARFVPLLCLLLWSRWTRVRQASSYEFGPGSRLYSTGPRSASV